MVMTFLKSDITSSSIVLYIIKIEINSSCEIKDFVENQFRKLCYGCVICVLIFKYFFVCWVRLPSGNILLYKLPLRNVAGLNSRKCRTLKIGTKLLYLTEEKTISHRVSNLARNADQPKTSLWLSPQGSARGAWLA